MIQNRSPLAIDAQREWEEEPEELGQVDRSRYVYKFRSLHDGGFTLKSLAERSLFCRHYKAFNDLFEFRFQYDRHPANTDGMFDRWRKEFPQVAPTLSRKMIPIYGIEITKAT
jgi:hypothetical protein